MKTMLWAALLLLVAWTGRANAITWSHDCGGYYLPWDQIHYSDDGTDCQNYSTSGGSGLGQAGHCSTARYNASNQVWSTELDCTGTSAGATACTLTGVLNCSGTKQTYSLSCGSENPGYTFALGLPQSAQCDGDGNPWECHCEGTSAVCSVGG